MRLNFMRQSSGRLAPPSLTSAFLSPLPLQLFKGLWSQPTSTSLTMESKGDTCTHQEERKEILECIRKEREKETELTAKYDSVQERLRTIALFLEQHPVSTLPDVIAMAINNFDDELVDEGRDLEGLLRDVEAELEAWHEELDDEWNRALAVECFCVHKED